MRENSYSPRVFAFEPLERREMLAASVSLNHGTLELDGTAADERVTVAKIMVGSPNHRSAKLFAEIRNAEEQVVIRRLYEVDAADYIMIRGQGGNDVIVNNTDIPSSILAGPGNDTVVGGLAEDHITAGSGNDNVFGRRGRDNIDGSLGDDFLVGHAGDDTLRGGARADRLLGESGDDTLKGHGGLRPVDSGTAPEIMGWRDDLPPSEWAHNTTFTDEWFPIRDDPTTNQNSFQYMVNEFGLSV